MDPLEFNVNLGCFGLVPGCLSESLRLSHLTNPWLDGHKFIARTIIDLCEFVIVTAEVTSCATLDLFDLRPDLSLFFLSLLLFSELAGLLGIVETVVFTEVEVGFVIIGPSSRTLDFLLFFLLVSVVVLLIVVVDVGVPHHDCLVIATC